MIFVECGNYLMKTFPCTVTNTQNHEQFVPVRIMGGDGRSMPASLFLPSTMMVWQLEKPSA